MLAKQMNIQASVRPDVSKYSEILVIEVDGGPKHTQEIENMEKLLLAWNSKLLFRCRFRQCTEIDQGRPVGFVLKNGNIVCKILSHRYPEQVVLECQLIQVIHEIFLSGFVLYVAHRDL
ncbi:hypothetical protein DPMN_154181 [Dreissena polymorpha]|uniref:Uncharacterized protein n=1 Tax=Dreissena polymorpha TaxID=45954 RepID=A0A9D4FNR0_DREPO|nr:hypothetical protein DPMN_154181 [Dreissena polymorpha]